MAIEELVAIIQPPEYPSDAGPKDAIRIIENALGMALPNDLYDFGLRYGTGMFGDTIQVYNPFWSSYLDVVRLNSDLYRDLKRAEADDYIPYEIYPNNPGLFTWGHTVEGDMMFWLTEGRPNEWPIILNTHSGQFERWDLSLTSFLAKVIKCEVECILWDSEWANVNFPGIQFRPR